MKTKVWLLYFALTTVTFSCTKIIDVEVSNPNDKIVVSCIFRHESTWSVKVTNSIGLGENNGIDYIRNATVNILDENSDLIETLPLNTSFYPIYITRNRNESMEGKTYKIEVSAPGYETVFSESYIPLHTDILNASRTSILSSDGTTEGVATIQFQDRVDEENYYQISLIQYKYRVDTNSITGEIDTVYVSKSKSKLTSYSLDVAEPRINRVALYLSDNSFNGNLHSLSFNYKLEKDTTPSINSLYITYISLLTFSEEAYKFYTSRNKYNYQLDNPFSEYVTVYSNIENGLGIFGGFSFANKDIYSRTR